jgi:hypothetical protein
MTPKRYTEIAFCGCILISAIGGFGAVTCKTNQCSEAWRFAAANSLTAAGAFGTFLANPPTRE